MRTNSRLSDSQERYLATILMLEIEKACAKPGDIACRLGVHRSSVTAALRALAERDMIDYEPYGEVVLSPRGKKVAKEVIARRRIIREFLVSALDMDLGDADHAACRMQHAMPETVITKMASQLGNGESL